ncbi:MAG: tryptophan-rich sensory protein [Anaerolineales bacterium]|nr:tryptophan-rich sensory protein [Anaerolineales bacterium]
MAIGFDMSLSRSLIGLIVWMAICFGAGWLGSIFTTPSIPAWYADLIKPSWTPPGWVFGPVWSVLYLMMAIAAWLVWRHDGLYAAAVPITLFMLQLLLNAAWSILFFGLRLPGVAFLEIVILWFAIFATLIAFWRTSTAAGYLLLPYLVWVAFAAALNFAIWRMNTGGLV